METYAVTLRPRGSCASHITANTLFGAVCWALETLRLTDVAELLAGFSESPRFLFSSAFPFIQGPGGMVRFFPRPAIAMPTAEQMYCLAQERAGTTDTFKRQVMQITGDAKRLKKAAYVSQDLFHDICAGNRDALALLREWGGDVERVGNALWLEQERRRVWDRVRKPEPLWRMVDVQRNAIDRVAGATAEGLLFHESQMFYARDHAGLWFLTRADRDAWKWLEAAFRYLADTGLGGKRTVGKGHFDFVAESAADLLPEIADPDSFVTLSCYLPPAAAESDQMEVAPRSYTLVTAYQKAENKFPGAEQMRVYSGRVCLFGEGSIFALEGERRPWYGRLAPLGQVDERTIYYNGLAFPAFARLGGVT